ncbi:phage protein NinX family protein [Atlantibacter hermannii]|uniref:phage protein NinX family protein n=1 Tax=Atlantibacter hermannii TaxID=565 RepID=UPI0028AC4B7D|nr:phage protein NinX family protein [Atlantibacter hermannii]
MKVKTAELSGRALDWAVGKAIGANVGVTIGGLVKEIASYNPIDMSLWQPTNDWSICGPLIDGYSPVITICRGMVRTEIATLENDVSATGIGIGITYTISFCRALVSLKLGDEVDIPDEMMETTK